MQRSSGAMPASARNTTCLARRLRRECLPVLLALGCAAAGVQAVELGEIRMHSSSGSQLRASIPLSGADALESEARCFNGVLLDANGQSAGSLKVALQRSAAGSMLLLAGAAAEGRQVNAVQVQNTCGTGAAREYVVTLAAAPVTTPAPSTAAAATVASAARTDTPRATERTTEAATPSQKLQNARAQEEALSRKLKSLEAKLGKVLSAPDARAVLQATDRAGATKVGMVPPDVPLVLKLERALAAAAPAGAVDVPLAADWTEQQIGSLLIFLLACTGAGIFLHLRKPDAPVSWLPAGIDSGPQEQAG